MSRLDDLRAEAEDMLDEDDDLLIEVVNELDNLSSFADGFRGYPMYELDDLYGDMSLREFLGHIVMDCFDVSDDYFVETIYGLESTSDLASRYRDNTTNDEIIDRVLVTPRFRVSDSDFMGVIADIDDYDEDEDDDDDESENESVKVNSVVNKIIEGADIRKVLR